MFNGTDTSGFGYPANGASILFNNTEMKFREPIVLRNHFDAKLLATSGAAICDMGHKKMYISIQTDGFIEAALVLAEVGYSNVSAAAVVINTPFLAHHVACSPSASSSEIFLVINDPFSSNVTKRTLYSAVVYDFQKRVIVREIGSTEFSTAPSDSCFSFSQSRSTAWMMQQSTLSFYPNSGSITVLSTTSSSPVTYTLFNYVPLQVDGNTIDDSGASGFAMQVDNDGDITGIFYGTYKLDSSSMSCSFDLQAELSSSLSSAMWNDGQPWWFCTKEKVVFAIGAPTAGDSDVSLTALKLPLCTESSHTRIHRGTGEQRSIAGLAGLC